MATTSRLVRYFSTSNRLCKLPNIQKPRVPGTERRILDAVTVPIFPPDIRPLPQQCYDEIQIKLQAKTSEFSEAFHAFRLQQAIQLFTENSMVAICHILPMTPRDGFNVKSKIVTAGMKYTFVKNNLAQKAVQDTKLQNLQPYMISDNVYITSDKNMMVELVNILKKTSELQLLGAFVEGRIMSRDDIMKLVKLPKLDILRGELLTILSASSGKKSRLLSRHQEELTVNLDQLIKQGGTLTGER